MSSNHAMQRFRSLPLVPVSGGRLTAPARLPVEAPGSWAGGVSSALRKLGCRLLDASALPEDATEVCTHSLAAQGRIVSQLLCRKLSDGVLHTFWRLSAARGGNGAVPALWLPKVQSNCQPCCPCLRSDGNGGSITEGRSIY